MFTQAVNHTRYSKWAGNKTKHNLIGCSEEYKKHSKSKERKHMCIALRQTFEKATITINKGKMAAVFKTCSPSQGAGEMSDFKTALMDDSGRVVG